MEVSKKSLRGLWILLLISDAIKDVVGLCSKPSLSKNAVLDPSDILWGSFDEKSTLALQCLPGFEPTAASPQTLTCEGGQWEPAPGSFICQTKSRAYTSLTCGLPPAIPSGQVQFKSGQELQYVCSPGFTLRRDSTTSSDRVRCLGNGSWSKEPQCVAVCTTPLGLKDGRITNRQMTASTVLVETFWGGIWDAHRARLDNEDRVNAWSPYESDRSQWLQVDLNRPKTVTGIVTQGAKDFGFSKYVTKFKVAYSNNTYSWTVVSSGGEETIFQGNTDDDGHQTNMFDPTFDARYVRFLPWEWHDRITLRMELLGC
ncbi:lactadherin-like [Engraulis encrasicolus]|uniref:lactadherin-like n=1 Tax=Engraulis encrasicolus TaxID=184585 RepID=UPI002FD3D4E2